MKLGNTTRELVEVTEGLQAGEQVVLNPQSDDPDLELLSHGSETPAADAPAAPSTFTGSVAASH